MQQNSQRCQICLALCRKLTKLCSNLDLFISPSLRFEPLRCIQETARARREYRHGLNVIVHGPEHADLSDRLLDRQLALKVALRKLQDFVSV